MVGGNLGTIFASIRFDTSGVTVGVQKVQQELRQMGQNISLLTGRNNEQLRTSMMQTGRMMAATSAAITAGLGLAVREAAKFESAMRNVNTMNRLNEQQFAALNEQVKKVAVEFGKTPEDLATGLYDIASAGIQGAEGLEVLRASALAARAGLATTQEAANSLVTVLNAYGLSASESGHVSDVLFKTVERGVLRFSDLSANIGMVATSAAAAKVPLEEIGAAFAIMTKKGFDTSITATALNRIIMSFLDPSKELTKAIKAAGYESGASIIQTKGLSGAVAFLQQVTGGSVEALASLGFEQRAFRAALVLTDVKGYTAELDAMKSAAGAAAAAYKEQEKSLVAQWEKTAAAIRVMATGIGSTLVPTMKSLAELVGNLAKSFTGMSPAMQKFIAFAAAITAALLGLSGAILMIGAQVGMMLGGFALAGVSVGALGSAILPVIAIIAALGLATWGVIKAVQYLKRDEESEARTAIESAKAKSEQIEKARGLVSQYETLAQKTNRTAEENATLRRVFAEIKAEFPELIRGTNLQADAMARLANMARAAGRETQMAMLHLEAMKGLKIQEDIEKQEKWIARLKAGKYQMPLTVAPGEMKDIRTQIAEEEVKLAKLREDLAKSETRRRAIIRPPIVQPTPISGGGGGGGGGDDTGDGTATARKKTIQEIADEQAQASLDWLRQERVLNQKFSDEEYRAGLERVLAAKNISREMRATATSELQGIADERKRLDEQNEQQRKSTEERALADRLARQQAGQDAYIALLEAQDNEVEVLRLKAMQRERALIESGADPRLAFMLAWKEAENEYQQLMKRQADEAMAQSLKRLDYQLAHNRISLTAYIETLSAKLAAEEEFSDSWYAIQGKIEDAYAARADDQIRTLGEVTDKNREEAIKQLRIWLTQYQAMGDAGVAACKRIEQAIEDLTGKVEKIGVDLTQMWTSIFESLRDGVADTIVAWMEGITSFSDMWKQIWHQILLTVVKTLLQMTILTEANIQKWASGLADFFKGLSIQIKGSIAEIAASVYGLMGLFSKDEKKRKKSWLGGLLGMAAAAFIPGLGISAFQGLTYGAAAGQMFDKPTYDTAAVRSGQDMARLIRQGITSEVGDLGRQFPKIEKAGTPAMVQDNRKYDVKVTTHVEKVMGIEDLERISETQAWIIGQKLRLAPAG